MKIITKYFPDLFSIQIQQLSSLEELYRNWNDRINVISRKDIEHLYERHILHSLAIARFVEFEPGTKILDVGTGGGFPGIPLAILFPETKFHLVDSIGKKIKVVNEVSKNIGLKNLTAEHVRMEQVKEKFDFVISRAVAETKQIINWTEHLIAEDSQNELKNGWILLKGGDLKEELKPFEKTIQVLELRSIFEESFFKEKKLIYLPAK